MLGMMLRLLNALGVSARWCGAFRRSGIVVEAQAPAARGLDSRDLARDRPVQFSHLFSLPVQDSPGARSPAEAD